MGRQRDGHGVAWQAARRGIAVRSRRAASQGATDANLREVQARRRILGDCHNGGQTRHARHRPARDGIPTRLAYGVFEGYLYEVKVTHVENSEDQQEKQGQNQGELDQSLPVVPLKVLPHAGTTFSHAATRFLFTATTRSQGLLEGRAVASGVT
jgi:hypothetical protein